MAHALIRMTQALALLGCLAGGADPVHAADAAAPASLRDPMRPPMSAIEPAAEAGPGTESARTEPAALSLTSILRGEGRAPRALIDGAWLTPGDTVGPWRVRRIGVDDVLLTAADGSGQEKRLALHAVSILRRSP